MPPGVAVIPSAVVHVSAARRDERGHVRALLRDVAELAAELVRDFRVELFESVDGFLEPFDVDAEVRQLVDGVRGEHIELDSTVHSVVERLERL